MTRLNPATRNIAIGRLQAGESQNEVARTLNVNQSTIPRLWNIFQQTGSMNDRQRSGRPRIITPGQDRYIRVFLLRIEPLPHQQLQPEYLDCEESAHWLRQHGIRPRRPYFGAVLTPLHRRERVRWCNRLRGWSFRNWRRIWFSDESRFLLQKHDGRIRVYRRRNEHFSSSCVQEVDSFGGSSVMMWVAISNDRKTDLVHVPGNLTAVRHRNEILQPHLMHVIDRQRELFQQDNARPHTARVTMNYLEQNNINVLPWPYKSPDLNPIEHLWDQLDKRVRQRQPPPQTLDQLRQMLQQEWRTIPRNNVRNLIESMPRRWRAVLAACGGHTRY